MTESLIINIITIIIIISAENDLVLKHVSNEKSPY